MKDDNGKQEKFHLTDIDQNRLDEEWLHQPKWFYECAEALAEAKSNYEQSQINRDIVSAELDREIRHSPQDFDVEKITDKVVEKVIEIQKEYIMARRAVIKAKHHMDICQARVTAMDHRKKALENLVQLRLANYFSEPKAKGDAGEFMGELKRSAMFSNKKKASKS